MKKIVISDTATGVVSAKRIVSNLNKLEERIESSKVIAENLFKSLDGSSNIIKSTDSRFFGGYSTKDLYNLIIDNHKSDVTTTKVINNLIKNNNENIKDMSKMIASLAMLSGMSFEQLSENTTELEGISSHLKKGVDNSSNNSKNLTRVIVSQIERVKEEKKKQEKIDYNFGILNSNFKELQVEFNEYNKINDKKIKEVKKLYQSTSEDHFIKILKRQKTMIYVLFFLFILSVTFQITQFII